MDVTTHKYLFDESNGAERDRRLNILLCSFAAFVSITTLTSAITLYSKQTTASIFNESIDYFPHRNYFSSDYLAARGYSTCQSQAQASVPQFNHGDCAEGNCAGNSAELPGTADITRLVLECYEDENILYTEFAQELFHGMGNGLSIEIIKRHWSF